MKLAVAAFFLLILTLTITSTVHSQSRIPESVNPADTCCHKYLEKILPRKLVVGYSRAMNCHLPAIIFITKKKREVCANPSDSWVQEYIKDPNLPLLSSRKQARVKIPVIRRASPSSSTSRDAQISVQAQVWERKV
ncbi:C-C motif chemokine 16 [Dasypus novemcinctus]|uniref:C-C motif chemokine 16 n=1 Tax=Dasypus novemcinctus TaxID=9361 RepID=UPI0003288411|nr:C-C motif chemokine 16 [Dasypus novemcinctus]